MTAALKPNSRSARRVSLSCSTRALCSGRVRFARPRRTNSPARSARWPTRSRVCSHRAPPATRTSSSCRRAATVRFNFFHFYFHFISLPFYVCNALCRHSQMHCDTFFLLMLGELRRQAPNLLISILLGCAPRLTRTMPKSPPKLLPRLNASTWTVVKYFSSIFLSHRFPEFPISL